MSSAKILLAGDIMLGRLVNEYILSYGPEYPLYGIEHIFRSADFSLANLECQIARSGELFPNRAFYFRADPTAANALKRATIKCVSLANNHMMDFGEEALQETIKHLDSADIAHAGAGENIAKAEEPAIVTANNLKIGILSFADHYEEYAAAEAKPGTNYTEITTKGNCWERVKKLVTNLRNSVDILIFSIHWGPNMRQQPTKQFVEFAHAVMDLGVDIYHGHSAHLFQGIEIYNDKPIFYDTGDLVDDYYVGPEETNDQQLLFLINTKGNKITRIELIPVYINSCQTNLAKGWLFDVIFERIRDLSAEMGTKITRKDSRIEVVI